MDFVFHYFKFCWLQLYEAVRATNDLFVCYIPFDRIFYFCKVAILCFFEIMSEI